MANIRLVRPPLTDSNGDKDPGNQVLDEEEDEDTDPVDKRLAAVPEALRAYANLIFLVGRWPLRTL